MKSLAASSQFTGAVGSAGLARPEDSPATVEPTRITAVLRGGLGNQLFQYAMARSLSLRLNADLYLDDTSEFILDREYRRTYALSPLVPSAKRVSRSHIARWLALRAFCKASRIARCPRTSFDRLACGRVLHEAASTAYSPVPALTHAPWTLYGYWQSPRYFEEHACQIGMELAPPRPTTPAFLAAADAIRGSESVAVGLRLYEESRVPESHASDLRLKSADEFGSVVRVLRKRYPGAKFVFLCSHYPSSFSLLDLPDDTVIATPDNGFGCPLGSLWLMSQCKHHVIGNSSLYWWGAWMSQWVHAGCEQDIFAASNFKNADAIPEGWVRF